MFYHFINLGSVSMMNESYVAQDEGYQGYHSTLTADLQGIRTWDRILGSLFSFVTLVGLTGNGSACVYFWPRRKKTIHDLLYLAITAVDFITVLSSIPVIASLLNDRFPTFFGDKTFCDTWVSVTEFSTLMSIFLATLICVTRTVVMKYPQRPLKRSWVTAAIFGYAVFLLATDLTYLSFKWTHGRYSPLTSYCSRVIDKAVPAYYAMVSFIIKLTLPSFITLACFVVGTWILMTRPVLGHNNDRKFRRVSVTIAIFTAVFLVCNVAFFLYQMWLIFLAQSVNNIYSRTFQYYDRILLLFFPIFLNATVNPLLYLLRMRGYQNWFRNAFTDIFGLINLANDQHI